ncbi:hypothetical protein HMI56_001411 [Coelomomyces lativittatus]|nr:hypothetical protein HMI56_001411 [Coelomomyces lativittatus]
MALEVRLEVDDVDADVDVKEDVLAKMDWTGRSIKCVVLWPLLGKGYATKDELKIEAMVFFSLITGKTKNFLAIDLKFKDVVDRSKGFLIQMNNVLIR